MINVPGASLLARSTHEYHTRSELDRLWHEWRERATHYDPDEPPPGSPGFFNQPWWAWAIAAGVLALIVFDRRPGTRTF